MDFFVWQRTCVDEAGNVLPSASVTVTDVVSGALAQLYSDPAGSVGIGNPITADSEGFVQFYVKAGFYNITATSGASSRTWTREAIGAPHPLTAAEISAGVTPVDYRYPEGHVYRYGTNTTPGTTDMTTAIQAAVDVVKAYGGGVVTFPFRETLAHSDTIRINSRVRLDMNRCELRALPTFPETIQTDNLSPGGICTIHAPQVLIDSRGDGSNTSANLFNGFIRGGDDADNIYAPVGLTVVGGPNIHIDTVHCTHHKYANFVIDGPQNSLFTNLRGSVSLDTNFVVQNVTQYCTFIACNGRDAGVQCLLLSEDEDYPYYRAFPGKEGPENCVWMGSIYEGRAPSAGSGTQERIIYIEHGTQNTFIGIGCAASGDELSVCSLEISASSSLNEFININLHAPISSVPAIIQRGFRSAFYRPKFTNYDCTNLVEVYGGRTTIVMPHYAGNTVSGKYVANFTEDGTPSGDPRRIQYVPPISAGSATQLPTENVDSYYTFFETTTDNLLVWDFNAQNWQNVTRQSATAAQLADAGHAINTLAKYEGKMVYDTTNNVPLWAAGSSPTAVWQDLINEGEGDITPS